MNPVLERLGGYPIAALQDRKRQLAADGGAALYDFSIGDPVEPTPAFVRQALVQNLSAVSQYPTTVGLPALRAAIAGYVRRRFGVRVDPDRHVLPTAGSKEAIFHLPLALVGPGTSRRALVWGDPGYPVYERGMVLAGGESDPVPLTEAGRWRLELAELDPARLDRACLAWVNYPHNPTGAVVDRDYYVRSLALARDRGVVLASDECYCDVHPVDAEPPPSLLEAAGDPEDPDLSGLLVAFSLSKRSGMTGYRCGALVGDERLIAAQRVLRPNIGTASPEFVQHAAIAAWSDDAHAAERRAVFDAKRDALLTLFEELGMRVSGSGAALYVWVRAPGGDDLAYAEALLRHRVMVSPGRAFGPSGAGWLRLALVPDLAGCRASARRWREAVAQGALPGH